MPTRPPLTDMRILLATWFGAGYAPAAPGTFGSLFAIPVGWAFAVEGGVYALALAAVGIALIGVWAADGYMAATGEHDASPIVIDEVAGQWIALLPAVAVINWQTALAAFVLFRLFDILKPWPISWVDRNVEGGVGVMADDVLAGIAAAACLYALMLGAPRLLGIG